jgi:hypothetical protein
MMKLARSLSILFAAALAGCQATYKHTLNFNPSEPIRIAVLPFAQVDSDGTLTRADESLLIDSVGLVSSKQRETPAELSNASLDVITPAIVQADLLHYGYATPGSNPVTIDLQRVFAADPREICTKVLSCDAVMYGKVTRWDRSYYGIQSVATVAINLKLVSAKTGKLMYEIDAEDSESRGISKGPTGFSNLALEPIKGLDNEIIQDLARDVADKAILPLSSRSRPEFLKTAPPAIIASGHDARGGIIGSKDKVVVIAFGSPGQSATFSVGNVALNIPMLERAPGHYIGEYVPLPEDSLSSQYVVVSLKDEFGRSTSQKLAKTPISSR